MILMLFLAILSAAILAQGKDIDRVSLPVATAGASPTQCYSCCPPRPAQDAVAITCSQLTDKLRMMDSAIALSSCGVAGSTTLPQQQLDRVCEAVTLETIPPCMLLEGAQARGQCLGETAEAIRVEINANDHESGGGDVVKNCKCSAFDKIRGDLVSVMDMMCVSTGMQRQARTHDHHHHDIPSTNTRSNTLWFQYAFCQDKEADCWHSSDSLPELINGLVETDSNDDLFQLYGLSSGGN